MDMTSTIHFDTLVSSNNYLILPVISLSSQSIYPELLPAMAGPCVESMGNWQGPVMFSSAGDAASGKVYGLSSSTSTRCSAT
jgi:hypothetical protein